MEEKKTEPPKKPSKFAHLNPGPPKGKDEKPIRKY